MLSLKIQNVAISLEQLAMRATNEEEKSLLSVCKNVLDDAADMAMGYENMPMFLVPDMGMEEVRS